jgi:hypothetical protein
MGMLEVQGIVAGEDGLPYVQFRQLDDEGNIEARWQNTPAEAREVAQKIVEASMNAVYDAALIAWARQTYPEDKLMGLRLVGLIRDFRADIWGLADQPKDWRND